MKNFNKAYKKKATAKKFGGRFFFIRN